MNQTATVTFRWAVLRWYITYLRAIAAIRDPAILRVDCKVEDAAREGGGGCAPPRPATVSAPASPPASVAVVAGMLWRVLWPVYVMLLFVWHRIASTKRFSHAFVHYRMGREAFFVCLPYTLLPRALAHIRPGRGGSARARARGSYSLIQAQLWTQQADQSKITAVDNVTASVEAYLGPGVDAHGSPVRASMLFPEMQRDGAMKLILIGADPTGIRHDIFSPDDMILVARGARAAQGGR